MRLDLPESVELHVLVDYVARVLELNVLYETTELRAPVTLRPHGPIPRDQLLPLVRRVLRTRQLALVQSGARGWYEVVKVERMSTLTPPLRGVDELPQLDPNEVVAVEITLPVAEADSVPTVLEAALSKPGGRWERAAGNVIRVIDFVSNVRRAVARVSQIQSVAAAEQWRLVPVERAAPHQLATLIETFLAEPTPGGLPATAAGAGRVRVDPLGRGVLIQGPPDWTAQVQQLVAEFDVAEQQLPVLYRPRFVDATRLQEFIAALPGGPAAPGLVDATRNTFWLEATPMLHARLREYLGHVDVPGAFASRPLRIYKLLNRRADDMFATLGGLLGGTFAAPGAPATEASTDATTGLAGRTSTGPISTDGRSVNAGYLPVSDDRGSSSRSSTGTAGGAGASASIQGDGYSLALDEHTNSIIAIATPEIHAQLRELLEALDRRRPQVLVEVTLVSISLEDSLNLGVELSTLDLGDPWDYLLFTSFGLSSIDPVTGARRLTVMPGGSGILLAPDEVPILFQALQTRGNTRVFSAPKILVDDNATGRIESVAESPFTSVNASDTVATTAFAGFAKAGTQLSIEPHIAEGDHLELQYDLTVSSFTGAGSATVPPPRSSDTISSTVRVPDGHTVVVGGLLSETLAESVAQIPWIGQVPVLGALFSNRSESKSKVRLYAFIRPSILRHADFADLKYLSQKNLDEAEVDDGFPPSQYQVMR